MININKAIGIIISRYPTHDISACRDLGDRWVFVSNPDAYMKSTEVKIDDPRNKYLKEQ